MTQQELKTDLPVVLITINKNYKKLKQQIKSGEIDKSQIEKKFTNALAAIGKLVHASEKPNMLLRFIVAGH